MTQILSQEEVTEIMKNIGLLPSDEPMERKPLSEAEIDELIERVCDVPPLPPTFKGYKPIETGDSYGLFIHCSQCDFPKGETLIVDEMNYCWNCGAKIDWSDWSEK